MTALKERLSRVRTYVSQEADGALRDRVYRGLRTAILARDLVGGDRITELDLAATLDVSRTPLREAFRLLQAEGLVSMSDRRGIVVRGLEIQDLLEIYEIRTPLDALITRKVAQAPGERRNVGVSVGAGALGGAARGVRTVPRNHARCVRQREAPRSAHGAAGLLELIEVVHTADAGARAFYTRRSHPHLQRDQGRKGRGGCSSSHRARQQRTCGAVALAAAGENPAEIA